MDTFSRHAIRVSVAEICQIIGWTSIQTSPLEILTDILQEYIIGLGKIAARYALLFGQCEPNLHHVALAFKDMGISISELEEYVTYVESSSILDVPKYPIPKESHLNFLKPGSREVVTRPFHIHEHLPPMHPHLEDQEYLINKSPLTVEVSTSDSLSPLSSPKGIFKKPGDPISSDLRRGRFYTYEMIQRGSSFSKTTLGRQLLEDEIRPVREISSVMMTTSGFLSPAREGKLPEARTHPVEFCNPPSPEVQVSEPEQQQLLPQQQQPIEMKTEKKKKAKTVEVPPKKPDKENKNKEEPLPEQKESEDESKGKKLVTTKETSKLKAFKTGALKIQQKPPSRSPSPQLPKKAKLSPNSSQLNNTKQSRIKSPKNDKRSLSPLVKDSVPSSLKECSSEVDVKLPSEPDKQKLNIFKKITKLKEDSDEFKLSSEHRETNSFLQESSSGLLKKISGDANNKDNLDDSDAQIDVEHTSPPAIDAIPETPAIEKTIEIPKVAEPRKKKKDKQKERKDLSDKEFSSKNKVSLDENMSKGKSLIEPDSLPEDYNHSALSVIPPLVPAPGLIPPWTNNPLCPLISPSINISAIPSGSFVTTKKQEIPANLGQQEVLSSSSAVQVLPATSVTEKDNDLLISKKKKRDKKLKDKIKKKKEKKLKNKIKDKSERKKLKLEKKEKAKLKSKKEKKEKKKEKELFATRTFEQSHIAEDVLNTLTPWGSDSLSKKMKMEEKDESSAQVPKITFKLGPASPKDITESPCPRKIVIKPIVKKEEENLNPGTSSTLETSKTHSSTPKVKSHKGGKTVHHKNEVLDKTPGFLFPQILPVKQDPFPVVPKWEADPNQVWICPACSRPDDGSPMIACDMCDLWFHWTCVGIVEAIESDWYCKKCSSKREDGQGEKKKKHRKKKN